MSPGEMGCGYSIVEEQDRASQGERFDATQDRSFPTTIIHFEQGKTNLWATPVGRLVPVTYGDSMV